MPQYRITAWKYHSELLKVRRELFQLGECAPPNDERRKAVDLIAAWRMRCALPHTIESTALLVDAKLHQEIGANTTFSMRATYAAAFSRFVTGFCDIGQINRDKKSMFEVAVQIGMPPSFVELRHEATHHELPSLQRLAKFTQDGLAWLWQYYWEHLDDNVSSQFFRGLVLEDLKGQEQTAGSTSDDIQDILDQFLRQRKREIKESNESFALESASAMACVELAKNCKGDKDCLVNLVNFLVTEKMLVPGGRTFGDSLEGAFRIWDNLLRRLTVYQKQFLPALLSRMTSLFAQPSVAELDPLREAIMLWMLHIFESLNWRAGPAAARVEELRLKVVSEAICSSTNLAKNLVSGLVHSGDHRFKSIWEPLLEVYSTFDVEVAGDLVEKSSTLSKAHEPA